MRRRCDPLANYSVSRLPGRNRKTTMTVKLDVLWRSSGGKEAILLELKTKKKPDQAINKEDVGQGFNHLQWLATALKGVTPLGLVFVSPIGMHERGVAFRANVGCEHWSI